jgi:hypothetical protein
MNEKTNEEMNENSEAMRMNCSEFEEALDDLDRAGTPGLTLREAALGHAEGCSRCAQLMTDTEALDFSLQKLAMRDADLQAPPRVEAALLGELRHQKAAASRRKGQWRMASLATAAAVLLTLGISLWHVSLTGAKGDGGNNAAKGSVLKAVSDAVAPDGPGSVEVAENVATDAQDASEFVSLPYATDPATLEGGTVVRVELSRSALASMGMPVADGGSLERIPADILLSEDGAPQAIRLVSSGNFEQ